MDLCPVQPAIFKLAYKKSFKHFESKIFPFSANLDPFRAILIKKFLKTPSEPHKSTLNLVNKPLLF